MTFEHFVPAAWKPERAKACSDLYYTGYQGDPNGLYMPAGTDNHIHLNRGPRTKVLLMARSRHKGSRRNELLARIYDQAEGRFQQIGNIPEKEYDRRFEGIANTLLRENTTSKQKNSGKAWIGYRATRTKQRR